MPRGRSIRRCRCHLSPLSSTDTIGPHDTHSDLAITRPGRYYTSLWQTVASAQKEDCSGDVVSVSIRTTCQASDCAIGEKCPRVKQSESITQCSATPAPSSRRAIRKHLSIASHIAMFQKMQRRPRDLQLPFFAAPHSNAPRPWRAAPRSHDAFAAAGVDFMIQKGSCIQSMMNDGMLSDTRDPCLYFQLDRVTDWVRCPTKPTGSEWRLPPRVNPFPGASSPNIYPPTLTTACS